MADPNPTKFCLCGCGELAPIAKFSTQKRGWIKGQPMRYVFGHQCRKEHIISHSYRKVTTPEGRKLLHVVIAEKALGKPLPPRADVHHVDGNRHNNANTNLVICEDRSYHRLLHIRTNVYRAGGDPNTQRICHHCRQLVFIDEMYRDKASFEGRDHFCKPCRRAFSDRTRMTKHQR